MVAMVACDIPPVVAIVTCDPLCVGILYSPQEEQSGDVPPCLSPHLHVPALVDWCQVGGWRTV